MCSTIDPTQSDFMILVVNNNQVDFVNYENYHSAFVDIPNSRNLCSYWWHHSIRTLCKFNCDLSIACTKKEFIILMTNEFIITNFFKNILRNIRDSNISLICLVWSKNFHYPWISSSLEWIQYANEAIIFVYLFVVFSININERGCILYLT